MRFISTIIFSAFALVALVGCESMDALSGRVHDRFDAPQPQQRVFEMDQRAVFEAAQAALRRMDFQVTKAASAQGLVKAVSRIQPGNAMGESRQYAFELKIEDLAEGKTQVSAILHEQQESTSFSGATDIPVRTHGLYDSFFEMLAAVLKEELPAAPAK